MKNVRDQVRDVMDQKGISIQRLAVMSDQAYSNLYRFLMNGQNSRLDTLEDIAEALDCELVLVERKMRNDE